MDDSLESQQQPPPSTQNNSSSNITTMMIEPSPSSAVLPPPPHMILAGGNSSSGGDEHNPKLPQKRRAKMWIQEETRALIRFRRETDSLFNTSKSNKHLWDQISAKMKDEGFDRSATVCTDKWRNLLKEFKKFMHNHSNNNNSDPKISYYKEIEDILRQRHFNNSSTQSYNNGSSPIIMQFSDKGTDDTAGLAFGPGEAKGNLPLNYRRQLGFDAHSLAITSPDAIVANGVPSWEWRGTPENGGQINPCEARVINVNMGDYTRRIGINGTPDSIREAIKFAFRLRSKRAICLEDENHVLHSIGRDMPLGNYVLHTDEGITIKVCMYGEDLDELNTEEQTFYTEDEFHEYLSQRGWSCLREYVGFRVVNNIDQLCPGAIYRGV